jgi:uncharacterized membrane protein YbhN (UPF0104 family)
VSVETQPTGTQTPPKRPVLHRLLSIGRPSIAVLAAVAIAYAVVSDWTGVRHALDLLAWQSVVLSFLAAVAGTVTSLMSWRALLADEGFLLAPFTAGRVFLVGQLGKYLPGSVWSIVLQVELGKRAGVPRARVFTTSLAWVGLSLATALGVGVVGFPVLASADSGQAWILVAVLPVALVACAPPVLTRLVNLILRTMRKGELPRPLSWPGVLSAAGWLVGTWVFFGLHLWLLANALGAPGVDGVMRCIGGFALAMAAGFVFVFVPSGAGVREALIVAALAPVMPAGQALGIAVVSRLVFITADVVSAGVAASSGVRFLRRSDAAPVPDHAL